MEWDDIQKEDFAEYVKNMRNSAGLTQRSLADSLGISVATVKNYEDSSKKRMPKDQYAFIRELRAVCIPHIVKKRKRERS
jgi:transcriptional regulator with XRE-family HTH domain